jgi:glycosyltransferase involved in cell wall biosynthesis
MHAMLMMNSLPWPLHGGRQVNAHHLAEALVRRGHRVTLLLRDQPDAALLSQWPLRNRVAVQTLPPPGRGGSHAGRGWHGYWGVETWLPAAVAEACAGVRPDYIEACGLDTPLWLSQLPAGVPRVWLAADDAGLAHWSAIGSTAGAAGKVRRVREAITLWAYERRLTRWVDVAVAVAPADARILRTVGGFGRVLLTPNGIDADRFHPTDAAPDPDTAIFWGRLDFDANIEALQWFLSHVWPAVHASRPAAVLRIVGQNPAATLVALAAATAGVELIGPVEDLRPWVWRSAAVVLPLRSGAGIKNKLLEAAAMGKPIIASPRATAGVTRGTEPTWWTASSAQQWHAALDAAWDEPTLGARLGRAARAWVVTHHDWASHAIAREALVAELGADQQTPRIAA